MNKTVASVFALVIAATQKKLFINTKAVSRNLNCLLL